MKVFADDDISSILVPTTTTRPCVQTKVKREKSKTTPAMRTLKPGSQVILEKLKSKRS